MVVENVRDKYIAKYRRRLPSETENDGKAKAEKEEGGDEVYYVRLFSFVEGSLMSDANHLSPYSLHQYGQFVAYFCDLTRYYYLLIYSVHIILYDHINFVYKKLLKFAGMKK